MKRLLGGVAGVAKDGVVVVEDKADKLKNSVAVSFDKAKTNRGALVAKAKETWDITWFECGCGKTAPDAKDC